MENQVWMGTREAMQWVPAPVVDIEVTKSDFHGRANFTSGGSWVRRSKASAKTYALSWNFKSRAEVQPILDFADGIYGDGPLYYSDPFNQDRNVLPAWQAAPFMNCYDGPWHADGARPELVSNGLSIGGYPVESAVYSVTASTPVPGTFIPIPPGYAAHIGVHGSIVSGSVNVVATTYTSPVGGPTANMTLLGNTTQLTNLVIEGGMNIGFDISLTSATSGSIKLDGLVAQILPSGSPSPTGPFISGQGSSGLSFAQQPVVSAYSAALDKVSVAVDLIETEAWS